MRATAALLAVPLDHPLDETPEDTFRRAERTYDFIPDALWPVLRLGSAGAVLRLRAAGEARFFREMIRGQIRTIRQRRSEGRFSPALLSDLALYRREWRRWSRLLREIAR